MKAVYIVGIVILVLALSFGGVAGLVWLLAWATGWFVFTWKLAFGIWVGMTLLRLIFK